MGGVQGVGGGEAAGGGGFNLSADEFAAKLEAIDKKGNNNGKIDTQEELAEVQKLFEGGAEKAGGAEKGGGGGGGEKAGGKEGGGDCGGGGGGSHGAEGAGGGASLADVMSGLDGLGIDAIKDLFKQADADGDGKLDKKEKAVFDKKVAEAKGESGATTTEAAPAVAPAAPAVSAGAAGAGF